MDQQQQENVTVCAFLIVMHVIPLCRCICLLKLWQKELLKWECQVLWHTASHLKLFWSVFYSVSLYQH